jgi:hypothetical protein
VWNGISLIPIPKSFMGDERNLPYAVEDLFLDTRKSMLFLSKPRSRDKYVQLFVNGVDVNLHAHITVGLNLVWECCLN